MAGSATPAAAHGPAGSTAYWAAYATFEENVRGSIEPGKWADFTVLSQDVMTIPPPEILKTLCKMTVIAGQIVYQEQ